MSVTQEEAVNSSTQTFVSALVLNSAIAGAELLAFTLIRRSFNWVYTPRTFIPPEPERAPPASPLLLGWVVDLWRADPYALVFDRYGSVDAYCFLRFLRASVKLLLPIWLLSWAILLPVDAANTGNAGHQGLEMFTFGNVGADDQSRYWAHLVLAWVFTFWTLYVLRDEMQRWVKIRLTYLVSPAHSRLPQARTVLFTGVPESYLDEGRLKQLLKHIPGGTGQVWLNRHLRDMPDEYNARLKATKQLETASVKLIKTADRLRRKAVRAANKKGAPPLDEKWTVPTAAVGDGNELETEASIAERLVPKKLRPTHRLPSPSWMPFALPFVGKKVDTISYCTDEVARYDEALRAQREQLQADVQRAGVGQDETYKPLNSAFVLFNQQIGAHLAAKALIHHAPYTMKERYLEAAPEDIIWSNLNLNPYSRMIRRYISYAATTAIIIFWGIPVAFVGAVSNVPSLCRTYSWLAWICDLPTPVPGILSGILPPALLALLFSLLPPILRLLARFEGIPTKTGIELSLMTRYFIFLVLNGFLVVTVASGIINALPTLAENTTSFPTALAQNLPGASTFFLTFITLEGLAGSAALLLSYTALATYYLKLYLLGGTPRSVYAIKYSMRAAEWGTLFPNTTLLIVITIAYSIISPIINGLSCFSFVLLYFAHKYMFIWVLDRPVWSDTGGLFFPKAINHVLVGVYLGQVCLATLFFLARNGSGGVSAIPQGALMVVLAVITVGFHIILHDSYGPLRVALPLTLAHKSFGMPSETGHSSVSSRPPSATAQEHPYSESLVNLDNQGRHIEIRKRAVRSSADEEEQAIDQNAIVRRDKAVPPPAEDEDDATAFLHPAAHRGQQTVWLPVDRLGIAHEMVRDLRARGVLAAYDGAFLDEKSKVGVEGPPPDEDAEEV